MFYVANVSEPQLGKLDSDPLVTQVRARAAEEGTVCEVVCAAIEAEIMQLPPADRAEFLQEKQQAGSPSGSRPVVCLGREA